MDATGDPASMGRSLEMAGHAGRVVWVGLTNESVSIADPLFHRRELTLYATRNSAGDFPRIISLIEQGKIETTPWISHRFALDEVPDRFKELVDPEARVVKAVVEI
jgi:alcohol dehydrogenase